MIKAQHLFQMFDLSRYHLKTIGYTLYIDVKRNHFGSKTNEAHCIHNVDFAMRVVDLGAYPIGEQISYLHL